LTGRACRTSPKVLEDGHVVEDGTHTELLARDGVYARYWRRQSGGFIGVADAAE